MRQYVARRLTLLLVTLALALGAPFGIALANHQFGDVPTGNPFHGDIDALADSGVTLGCGDGNYCPKAFVTREQMAAFLNRLGALGPGKTPVVNADEVDGRDGNELTRVAYLSTTATTSLDTVGVEVQHGGSLSITAPAAGFVVVTASASLRNQSCSAGCTVSGQVLHVQSG